MGDKKLTVRAVERALDILLCFTEESELSLTEIAVKVSLNKSTVHRLLASLEGKGFLRRDPLSDRYRLGLSLWELSSNLVHEDDPAQLFYPDMRKLRDALGETISLYVRDERERIRIQAIESNHPIRRVARIGIRLPLSVGASGKALVAFSDLETQNYILRDPGWPELVDLNRYRQQLERISRDGYATSLEERESGTSAVAAPIFDRHRQLLGVLSVSGPVSRLTEEKMREIAPIVMDAAMRMGRMTLIRQ
ncbi:IclR family transcriptional regulator [Ammoniphilus oxalaticus]|uniref:Glycerol operon regulatory protein n=1 Tax=Ammoniphilus oxalaticus TaxID=66863 RepID=A0A419SEQ2_9BACL|nr:IclR family transcriptional regulator [Ammoniphilus oxalaticus]RKD21771.1 IclR family transcriptional regulator [Ammoniphilus oxalaticus]